MYELGLRNGDVPLTLNGYSLATYEDVGIAFSALWSNGETSYTLVVDRNSSNITLNYWIYVTL